MSPANRTDFAARSGRFLAAATLEAEHRADPAVHHEVVVVADHEHLRGLHDRLLDRLVELGRIEVLGEQEDLDPRLLERRHHRLGLRHPAVAAADPLGEAVERLALHLRDVPVDDLRRRGLHVVGGRVLDVDADPPGQPLAQVRVQHLLHLGHALDTLFARFKRRPFDHLVVGAPEELVTEVEEKLHPYLRARLAGRVGIDVENSSAADVSSAAGEVIDRHVAAVEREALDRMHQGIGRGDRGVSRPEPVMEALEQARVEILLLAEDFDAPELDEAVEKAITQSAQVLVIRHHDDLVMHGGIGAVLRF